MIYQILDKLKCFFWRSIQILLFKTKDKYETEKGSDVKDLVEWSLRYEGSWIRADWKEGDRQMGRDRYVIVLLSRGGTAAPLLPHEEKILHHLKWCKDKVAERGFYKGTKQRAAVKGRHSIPHVTLADLEFGSGLMLGCTKKKKKVDRRSRAPRRTGTEEDLIHYLITFV